MQSTAITKLHKHSTLEKKKERKIVWTILHLTPVFNSVTLQVSAIQCACMVGDAAGPMFVTAHLAGKESIVTYVSLNPL